MQGGAAVGGAGSCPKCALPGSGCSFKPQPGQACPNTVKIIKALSGGCHDTTPRARPEVRVADLNLAMSRQQSSVWGLEAF